MGAIFLLGGCAKSDVAEPELQSGLTTKSEKPVMIITIRFQGPGIGQTMWQAFAEYTVSDGSYVPSFGIEFQLKNTLFTGEGYPQFIESELVQINDMHNGYSWDFPLIRTEDTYVDGSTFTTVPASIADEYDIAWVVEVVPVKGMLPGSQRNNIITAEWDGTSWVVVAKYPLTSYLMVYYNTSNIDMPAGTIRIKTPSKEATCTVFRTIPVSDDHYSYAPSSVTIYKPY